MIEIEKRVKQILEGYVYDSKILKRELESESENDYNQLVREYKICFNTDIDTLIFEARVRYEERLDEWVTEVEYCKIEDIDGVETEIDLDSLDFDHREYFDYVG